MKIIIKKIYIIIIILLISSCGKYQKRLYITEDLADAKIKNDNNAETEYKEKDGFWDKQ